MAGAAANRMRGFTLIELAVVIVVIGVLTSVALVNVAMAKDRAYKAQMKADLRYLVVAQEAYYHESETAPGVGQYSASLVQLGFTPTDGVALVIQANADGWSAEARHSTLPTSELCAVFVGAISAPPPATVNGVPDCL